jgi:hypothetical protein
MDDRGIGGGSWSEEFRRVVLPESEEYAEI